MYVWIDEILWNIPPSVHHSSLRNLIIIIEARFRNLCSFFLVFSIFQKPESDFVKARCVSVIEFWHLSFDKSSRPQKFRVCSFLKCWPTFQSFWVVAVIFLRIERITQRFHGARVSSDNEWSQPMLYSIFYILISSFFNLILCPLLKESQIMPEFDSVHLHFQCDDLLIFLGAFFNFVDRIIKVFSKSSISFLALAICFSNDSCIISVLIV